MPTRITTTTHKEKDSNPKSPTPPQNQSETLNLQEHHHTKEKQVRSPRLRLIKGPAHLNPGDTKSAQPRSASSKSQTKPPKAPSTLHALGIVQLPIEDLRIIPPTRRIIDIEMPLNLPIDIDHRTIRTMIRDQNLNLRRPILLVGTARDTTPSAKEKTRQHCTHTHKRVMDPYVCG